MRAKWEKLALQGESLVSRRTETDASAAREAGGVACVACRGVPVSLDCKHLEVYDAGDPFLYTNMKFGKWLWAGILFVMVVTYAVKRRQPHEPDRRAAVSALAPAPSTSPLGVPPSGGVAQISTAASEASDGDAAKQLHANPPLYQWQEDWRKVPDPVAEPAFDRFARWAERYGSADAAGRAAMEAEGVALAAERRVSMLSAIKSDPQRALDLAVPKTARADLPQNVRAQLEEHVSGRGDYHVLAAIPLPGQRLGIPAVQRSFSVGDRTFEAFVYGHRVDAPTKRNIALRGIAVDEFMAVHEDAVRVLSAAESAELQAASNVAVPPAEEAICGISGLTATAINEPVAAEVGAEIVWLCRYAHAEVMNERLKLAAHEFGAVGGDGTVSGETAESPYTEGRKRIIMFRVAFSNLPTPDISSNQLVGVHAALDTFWRINSYGKTSVAELGGGSDIVQVTLANTYQTYDDNAGAFRDDVRAAATAAGIDLGKYDFDIVYSGGGRPSFSFGGLGYVGAPGSWVVGASRGITAHEAGHNLGFPHANFWDTGGQSAIGPGGNQEYGDPFDVMGGGGVDDGTGPGHYTSKFKWRIGWIPDVDFPRVTANGTYRIYAHDNPDTRNTRGVRFRRDASLDYFVDFRQRYDNNQWMMNGIGLRWGSTGGSSSQLIDTTPGSANGKTDSPIVIGRTFSDLTSPVHVTPLGFANTYPPSVDVRINFGTFPGNQPPALSLTASTTSSGVGGGITFVANASDPNNDQLAYSWDFGDATFSVENSPTVTKAWSTAGEYVVRCVVSDMKGGTASESITVQIGRTTTYSVRGRVLFNGQPVPDVLVKASSSRYAYTDTDGAYEISRLAAGSYTVSAQLYPFTFVNPFFANPVSVGPADAENIDFVRVIAPQNDVLLVASNAVWKYLDNGSNQGTNWSQPGFNDSLWPSGPAELGYGDDDEATEIGFGGDPANKYITYYFRRQFNITDPAVLTNFTLSFLRDDGGIVYVNGREVLRDNMPATGVTYLTTALGSSEEAAAVAVIDSSYFAAGNNLIAAEVHQSDNDSSDVSFNIWMTATRATNFTGINAFYLAQPGQNETFTSPADVTIRANGYSTGDSYSLVEFFANGAKLGEKSTAPFEFTYGSPENGVHRLTAVATLASGGRLTSSPVNITIVAPAPSVTLIASNAVWRYNDEAVDLGNAWIDPGYDDAAWSNGVPHIGFGDAGLSTTIRAGPTGARTPTFYFRHGFNIEDAGLITNLTATLYRDDGAVIYINGVEASRVLMPAGPVSFTTFASAGVDGNDEFTPVILALPSSLLVDGKNVLAVELHQQSATSSDARFGFELVGAASGSATPGVRITAPLAGTSHTAGEVVSVAATGIGQHLTVVEFYRDDTLLGDDSTAPHRFDWVPLSPGTFNLMAVAREAGGGAYTSAPVQVTINTPRTGRQLVSPQSAWRYLDDGTYPGTSWAQRFYNDSAWAAGYARLGYGGDGESTIVSFGPDASKKYVTTYFRHAFPVSDLAGISNLKLLLACDDGAVVYLNGVEIYRNNLLPGAISYNSLALANIDRPAETNYLTANISVNSLLIGTNVIAVEVHQDSIDSPDLGLDLALVAESDSNLVEGVYLVSPPEGAVITMPHAVEVKAFAVASEAINRVEFLVDGQPIGEDTAFPYTASWSAGGTGPHALTVVAHAGGASYTSAVVNVTVVGPPIPVSPVLTTFIPSKALWKYWPNVTAPPPDWNLSGYADTEWSIGGARLGFGLDGEATTLPIGRNSYYFRRAINVANAALIEDLIFQLQRDDGAVVYLNGVEVFRSNMPAGTITPSTPASSDATGLDEQQFFIMSVPANGLISGPNLIAVEVHQSSPSSSDIGFDMHLSGSGDTSPRILMSRPGTGSQFVTGSTVRIEAAAWPGQGRAVDKVEFIANGSPLAEVTTAPYTYDWISPTQGNHTVMARLTDNFGQVTTSRSVSFSVGYPVVRTNFIAAGSVWKYLDNGSNQGTSFAQFNYDDSGWPSGPAQLGYGDGDEATTVSYGPSATSKYITTYFRRAFQSPPGWIITNLSFRLLRDDGAIVWLNGRQLYRSNITAGTVNYLTPASSAVDGANEDTFFESSFTITNLAPANLVAVEIHQSSGSSSDISFDLELVGTGYIRATDPPTLQIVRNQLGEIQVSWPASFTGWQLYYSSDLSSGWTASSSPVTEINGHNVVTLTHSNGTEFYQLRQP